MKTIYSEGALGAVIRKDGLPVRVGDIMFRRVYPGASWGRPVTIISISVVAGFDTVQPQVWATVEDERNYRDVEMGGLESLAFVPEMPLVNTRAA